MAPTQTKPTAADTISFKSERAFNQWLARCSETSPGIWLRLFKKASGVPSITYEQALHEALCFGWIDGQKQSLDATSWAQRFTPRRSKSKWSKRNTKIIEKLIAEKRMKPSGLRAVAEAKADGRWTQAYDSPSEMKIPKDLLDAVRQKPEAYAFFKTLNKANLYAISWRLQTAKKAETRARRLAAIVAMLERREAFH
jgi:uncharacterized protein YdeI (YjbR/CyaY-like superfamily)